MATRSPSSSYIPIRRDAAIPTFVDDATEPPACTGLDVNLFFPSKSGSTGYDQGRIICNRCPLKEPCGEWALATEQEYGLYGALSPEDRAALRHVGRLRARTSVAA